MALKLKVKFPCENNFWEFVLLHGNLEISFKMNLLHNKIVGQSHDFSFSGTVCFRLPLLVGGSHGVKSLVANAYCQKFQSAKKL